MTADAIAERFEAWEDIPFVIRELFPHASPARIAAMLEHFVEQELSADIERVEFFDASVASVMGLRLTDGRRVVVKVHRVLVLGTFLQAMQRVQDHLSSDGYPCPRPLVRPTLLGRGIATVESLVAEGEAADTHDPAARRTMAMALADLVARCRGSSDTAAVRDAQPRDDGLWPIPHDGRFDFGGTAAGAGWIDTIARHARRIRDVPSVSDRVLGHNDWRAQNLRFANGHLAAVYDWESLRVRPEPVLVGSAAHQFTTNWDATPPRTRLPTLDEALAFISDYERGRGSAFDADEVRVAKAALVFAMAYTARCEHSDLLTDFGEHAPQVRDVVSVPAHSARAFLSRHAADLLGEELGTLPREVADDESL